VVAVAAPADGMPGAEPDRRSPQLPQKASSAETAWPHFPQVSIQVSHPFTWSGHPPYAAARSLPVISGAKDAIGKRAAR